MKYCHLPVDKQLGLQLHFGGTGMSCALNPGASFDIRSICQTRYQCDDGVCRGKNTQLKEVSRSLQTRRVPNNHDKCLSIDKNSRLSSWWDYRTVIPSANTSECVALLPDINVPFICARENGTGKQFVSESVTYLKLSQIHMMSVNTWACSCMSAYCFTFVIRRACGLHIEIWRLKCIVWSGDKNVYLSESLVGTYSTNVFSWYIFILSCW